MNTYIALLRAVNVGGYGKLPMASFRKVLEELGYHNVETYIQSGNAVFDAPGTAPRTCAAIATSLEKLTKAPVGVLLRTHDDLGRIIDQNPYAAEAAADGARVHAVFLSKAAPPEVAKGLDRIVTQYPARRDRFHVVGDTLYLHVPEGAAETKFQAKTIDRILGVTSTARNWNTVLKLHAMSDRGKSQKAGA
jgi:uncharacterized protein (DUF1697 family)